VMDSTHDSDTNNNNSNSELDPNFDMVIKLRFALYTSAELVWYLFPYNVYCSAQHVRQRKLADCDDELMKSLLEEKYVSQEEYSVVGRSGPTSLYL